MCDISDLLHKRGESEWGRCKVLLSQLEFSMSAEPLGWTFLLSVDVLLFADVEDRVMSETHIHHDIVGRGGRSLFVRGDIEKEDRFTHAPELRRANDVLAEVFFLCTAFEKYTTLRMDCQVS